MAAVEFTANYRDRGASLALAPGTPRFERQSQRLISKLLEYFRLMNVRVVLNTSSIGLLRCNDSTLRDWPFTCLQQPEARAFEFGQGREAF